MNRGHSHDTIMTLTRGGVSNKQPTSTSSTRFRHESVSETDTPQRQHSPPSQKTEYFSYAETLHFIHARGTLEIQFSLKDPAFEKSLWKNVESTMNLGDKDGNKFPTRACEAYKTKWKNLKNEYNKKKLESVENESAKTWIWFKLMDHYIGKKDTKLCSLQDSNGPAEKPFLLNSLPIHTPPVSPLSKEFIRQLELKHPLTSIDQQLVSSNNNNNNNNLPASELPTDIQNDKIQKVWDTTPMNECNDICVFDCLVKLASNIPPSFQIERHNRMNIHSFSDINRIQKELDSIRQSIIENSNTLLTDIKTHASENMKVVVQPLLLALSNEKRLLKMMEDYFDHSNVLCERSLNHPIIATLNSFIVGHQTLTNSLLYLLIQQHHLERTNEEHNENIMR